MIFLKLFKPYNIHSNFTFMIITFNIKPNIINYKESYLVKLKSIKNNSIKLPYLLCKLIPFI